MMSESYSAAMAWWRIRSQAIPSPTLMPVAAAFLVGGLLLFVTGFAGSDMLHAAAHDVRHCLGFVCH